MQRTISPLLEWELRSDPKIKTQPGGGFRKPRMNAGSHIESTDIVDESGTNSDICPTHLDLLCKEFQSGAVLVAQKLNKDARPPAILAG